MNRKLSLMLLLLSLIGLGGARKTFGDTYLYETAPGGFTSISKLDKLDVTTGVVTTLYADTTGLQPFESLVFDGHGHIIFNDGNYGSIFSYDLHAGTTTQLYFGFGYTTRYGMALDPGGNSAVIADPYSGITRFDLTTKTSSVLFNAFTTGVTYDNKGHLFAVLNYDTIVQLNPTTGAILKQVTLAGHAFSDLTFDPFTGQLWASDIAGDPGYPVYGTRYGLAEIPTDLSHIRSVDVSDRNVPDGIQADGLGNLYYADSSQECVGGSCFEFGRTLEYQIATNTFTNIWYTGSDIAPLIGLGSPSSSTPEPSSLLLLGTGLMALASAVRRRLR